MRSLVILAVLGFSAFVHSQSTCVTPNGENAQCISIYQCKIFVEALKNRTPEIIRFLRASRCGYKEDPLVCCGSVANYQQVATPPPVTKRPVTKRPAGQSLLPSRRECGTQLAIDRIIGGNETTIDEFPWMALLEYKGRDGRSAGHNCGGMLINKRYVLTAAHCVVGEITKVVGNLFRVRLGEWNKDTEPDCAKKVGFESDDPDCADPHRDINIEEAISHPDYMEGRNRYHDIAIVRLSENVRYSDFVKPICLPVNGERSNPGENLTVAGWGLTEKNIYSPVKLKAKIPLVADQQCRNLYQSRFNVQLQGTQLCVGGQAGVDSCSGDSGGPVMRTFPSQEQWYAEGIVSFGAVCGSAGVPGIYTRVSEYIDWIEDNMKPF